MKKISTFFYNRANPIATLLVTICTFVYLFFVMVQCSKGFFVSEDALNSLGSAYQFSPELVQEFYALRTPEMISAYQFFNLTWDSLFAVLYGIMYIFWISSIYKPLASRVGILNLLPVGQVLFDFVENGLLYQISGAYNVSGTISESSAQLASYACSIKWVFAAVIFLTIIIGFVMRFGLTMQKRKLSPPK